MHDDLPPAHAREDRRVRDVVVPEVVGDVLHVPPDLPGLHVESDGAVVVQVVAGGEVFATGVTQLCRGIKAAIGGVFGQLQLAAFDTRDVHAAFDHRQQVFAAAADDLQRLARSQPLGLEPVGQGALVGVGHHEVGAAVVQFAGVVDAHDVRRLDPSQVAPFLDEAAQAGVDIGIPELRMHALNAIALDVGFGARQRRG